jgi:alkylation response protein AidB-like acyl-CoA dehydrogenase
MTATEGPTLAKKLGLRAGSRPRLLRAPRDLRAQLARELAGSPTGRFADRPGEFVMIFARSRAEVTRELPRLAAALADDGVLWVAWPKKSSGTRTDLSDDVVRELGLNSGLVDVKVCAVNEVWSALKFVRRLRDRGPGRRATR